MLRPICRSDRTPSPGLACAARREGPPHTDGEMALGPWLSPTDASEATAWRRGSTCLDLHLRGWKRVVLRAAIDSLTNLVNSDAAHAPTKSRTSHFRVHPWRPYHHIAAFPQSRWASAVMPMASDLGDSEIGSSSSGSQHATPPCSHSLAKPHKFLGTLSVHELGRLCRYLPPTISRSVGRGADGERPWRQSSSSGSQYASLLPLASILARTR